MKKTTENTSICFAYFGDGNFLGWYADSFGSIRPSSPKIYRNSDQQKAQIGNSFRKKLARSAAETSAVFTKVTEANPAFALVANSGLSDMQILAKYDLVELRVVECPIYDGPNLDFDEAEFERLHVERTAKMKADGVFDIPAPSKERNEAIDSYPRIPCDNWIYADYTLVKAWAEVEPTEFIETL